MFNKMNIKLFRSVIRVNNFRINYYCSVKQASHSSSNKTTYNAVLAKSFCTPTLYDSQIKKINSVVGVNIGLTFITWARIEVEGNKLTHLNHVMFPNNFVRLDLNDIYFVVSKIINSLPKADQYVIETPKKSFSSTGRRLQLPLQVSHFQTIAIVVTLLNSIYARESKSYAVVFLKPRLVGRLFDLLHDHEMTSCQNTVNEVMRGEDSNSVSFVQPLPNIVTTYNKSSDVSKEIMGRVLLETLTFTELVLHKNLKCCEKVNGYFQFKESNINVY